MTMVPTLSNRPSTYDFVPYQKAMPNAEKAPKNFTVSEQADQGIGAVLTISPNWRAKKGLINCACFLVSSTNLAYLLAMRASAPHAMTIRMLDMVSLATAEDLASDCRTGSSAIG